MRDGCPWVAAGGRCQSESDMTSAFANLWNTNLSFALLKGMMLKHGQGTNVSDAYDWILHVRVGPVATHPADKPQMTTRQEVQGASLWESVRESA